MKAPTVGSVLKEAEGWAARGTWLAKAQKAQALLVELKESETRMSLLRRDCIAALQEQGWSQRRLAKELNISHARVSQIVK
jgi:DNA-directed RNA polymerase specialized sigma subunit